MVATATEGKIATRQGRRTPRFVSRPLESLAFLLPLILFYELGCLLLASARPTGDGQERVVAYYLLQLFFELFGSTGVWMPGLAVIVILLCTHLVGGWPWRVRRRAVSLMYGESVVMAVPLLLCSYLLTAAPARPPVEGAWLPEAVLGVGAGIYEELVFRLVMISVLAMVGTDFLKWPQALVHYCAIILSGLAFAAHHYPPLGSDSFQWHSFAFRAVAGFYLGVLFVRRGYGTVAGTHAVYNLMVTFMR